MSKQFIIFLACVSFAVIAASQTVPPALPVDSTENTNPIPLEQQISGTLPVLYVNVYLTDSVGQPLVNEDGQRLYDNEIISSTLAHKEYFTCAEYWLDINGCQWLMDLGAKSVGTPDEPLATQIKARGNYTREMFAKKPFKLKLNKKQNLLNLTPAKNKHYALLPHADDDHAYLRNMVGFSLGKRIGLPWTPSQQPLELVINGDYRGLYFLTESIRVAEGRVNITELSDDETNGELISGGYIVELDNNIESNQITLTESSIFDDGIDHTILISCESPELYSPLQHQFITEQFDTINALIGSNDDAIWRYLDLDDAVRYYIVEEIISNIESYRGSTFLFRDYGVDQKWHFSPIWDSDNALYSHPQQFFYEDNTKFHNTWIASLRQNQIFNDKVTETWLWFMSNGFQGIYEEIDSFIEHVAQAAIADNARWEGETPPPNGRKVVDNSDITKGYNRAVTFLNTKTAWLATQWGDYDPSLPYDEPFRDDTPAAPLPDYAMPKIEAGVQSLNEASSIKIYNLHGLFLGAFTNLEDARAVLRPGLYIIHSDSEASLCHVR